MLVPVTLEFESKKQAGRSFRLDAGADVPRVLHSPVFSQFPFGASGTTQYADAMLRATFPKSAGWHTLLGKPEVKPITVTIPAGFGYVLTSKKNGGSLAVVDLQFLQKEVFKQVPKQDGKLVLALTHNTTYYVLGDATVCCSWGTHGVDGTTGNSFVLASYLHDAPAIVEDKDVQPLTQQLAEFVNDPLYDPQMEEGANYAKGPGNRVSWMRPSFAEGGDQGRCGGTESFHALLPAGADGHEPQEQLSGFEGLCREGGRQLVPRAERCPAAVVRRCLPGARTAFLTRRC